MHLRLQADLKGLGALLLDDSMCHFDATDY
jgi:hypothetical protein